MRRTGISRIALLAFRSEQHFRDKDCFSIPGPLICRTGLSSVHSQRTDSSAGRVARMMVDGSGSGPRIPVQRLGAAIVIPTRR